jgi:hypothetical protein
MHIKFLGHGTGDPNEAAAYLIGTHDHNGFERAEVRVLRGDPTMVALLADSLSTVHRYTSGMIAWHVDDAPTDEEIEGVLNDYERVAFAGLEPDQYSWSAILHAAHDGSVHVHVFAARVELRSGKAFNIAPPRRWIKAFYALRDAWNHERGWARPDDPLRARLVQPGPMALVSRSAAGGNQIDIGSGRGTCISAEAIRVALDVEPDPKLVIADWLMLGVNAGLINNRQDVLAALAQLGDINRASSEFISVRLEHSAKLVRLKGTLFTESFDADAIRQTQNAPKNVIGNPRAAPNHEAARAARADLEAAIKRRTAYNRTRYPAPSLTAQGLVEATRAVKEQAAAAHAQQARDAIQLIRVRTQRPNSEPKQEQKVPHDRTGNNAAAAAHELVERVRAAVRSAGNALERLRAAALAAVRKDRGFVAVGRAFGSAVERFERATRKRSMSRDEELERFKREINLIEIAQSLGYEIDKKASSRSCKLMKRGGDKVVFATGIDGHGIYFSLSDESDCGSVIDFAQKRIGGNLGKIRKELRGWVHTPKVPSPRRKSPEERPERPEPVGRDRAALLARWHRLEPYQRDYLTVQRGLDADLVSSWQVRQDERGNACFPHFDRDEVCGWEAKNLGFSGFSAGGQRGIAFVRLDNEPARRVVVAESSIDAVSWAQVHGRPLGTAYVSLGGALGPNQIQMLLDVARQHDTKLLVLATDSDRAGDEMAARIEKAFAGQVEVLRDRPPESHKDWNDALLARTGSENDSGGHQRIRAQV